jgi:hypothetical protein
MKSFNVKPLPLVSKNFLSELITLTFIAITTTFLYLKALDLGFYDLRVVLGEGDMFGSYTAAQHFIQTGWSYLDTRLAFPEGMQFLQGRQSLDLFYTILLYGVTRLTADPILAVNITLVILAVINSLSLYIICKYFQVSKFISIPLSISFGLTPWVLSRLAWPSMTSYSVLVFGIFLTYLISSGDLNRLLLNGNGKRSLINKLALVAMCSFVFMGPGYYVFYLAIVCIPIILFSWSAKPNKIASVKSVALMAVTAFITIFLQIWLAAPQGKIAESVVTRSPGEALLYGGSTYTLFLPDSNSGLSQVASWMKKLDEDIQGVVRLSGEGDAAFSIIGAFAFISMLLYVLYVLLAPKREISSFNSVALGILAAIGLSAVFWFQFAGMNTILSSLVDLPIRVYGRLGGLITSASMILLAILLNQFAKSQSKKFRFHPRFFLILICTGLAALIVFDQVDGARLSTKLSSEKQSEVSEFIGAAESMVSAGCPVLTLPLQPYPNAFPIGTMGVYEQAYFYLFSENLKFTYGLDNLSTTFSDYKNLEALRDSDLLNEASRAGFCAIIVDQNGYEDLSLSPMASGAIAPLVESSSGRWLFFRLD